MKHCQPFAIAISTLVLFILAGTSVEAGLTNYWSFDEASDASVAADSVGTLDATLAPSAAFVLDAARGGPVLDLDAARSEYASNPGEPFTSDTNHTVAAWVRHDDSGELHQRWISWGLSGGRYFLGPYNSGRVSAGIGASTTFAFTDADATPVEGAWQHWAFVREGTSSRLYLNGNLVQTLTSSASGSINTSGQLAIGRQYNAGEYLNGRIDDLAIWDEPLDATQIQNVMNYGAEYYLAPPVQAAPAPELVYRETFYSDTGNDIPDPNGTVTGWHIHYGSGTRDTDAYLAQSNGETPLLVALNSNQQYSADTRGYFLPVNYNTSDYLFWTDEFSIHPALGKLEAMQWSIRTSATGMHAAVRVGTDWYATVAEFDVTVSNDVWETRFFDDLAASSWYALDFTEGSSLALTSNLFSSLPEGQITAFGVYSESTQRLRLDNFELYMRVPEPSALGLLLIGMIALGVRRRRRPRCS